MHYADLEKESCLIKNIGTRHVRMTRRKLAPGRIYAITGTNPQTGFSWTALFGSLKLLCGWNFSFEFSGYILKH